MQDPKTIAIIMDGNRRWARKSNLPVIHGHRKGIETLIKIVKASKRKGIKKLVVFAFSTENWSRQLLEVNGLMNLISFGTDTNLEELIDNEVKLTFIGNIDSLPSNQKKDIAKCIEDTKKFTSFNLVIGLNYGGHWDIVNSVKKIQYSKKNISEKNLLRFSELGDEDVEIFIRTGGEIRISNFLLLNIAYSELFFVDKLWPDFCESDLDNILNEYKKRIRRFGK